MYDNKKPHFLALGHFYAVLLVAAFNKVRAPRAVPVFLFARAPHMGAISYLKNMCSAHISRHAHYKKLKNMCTAYILSKARGFDFIRNYAILAYYFVKAGQACPLDWQNSIILEFYN